MKFSFGSDHLGLNLKKQLMALCGELGHEAVDLGCHDETPVDYPDEGLKVARAVAKGEYDRGVLVCGTGIGMAISANKVKGCYAAVCHDIYSTERSILSNNCNVMCLGALVVGPATAQALFRTWALLSFKESPSRQKINKIIEAENAF